jgi:hypothetical protein
MKHYALDSDFLYSTSDWDNFKDSLCILSAFIQVVLNKCCQRIEQIRKAGEQGSGGGPAGFSERQVRDSTEGQGHEGHTYML